MRLGVELGLLQGLLLPHDRPNDAWLAQLGTAMAVADDGLRANALSASAMWAANAATVSPAPDTRDGRCHITVANLLTMPHRSHEWPQTLSQLRLAFADSAQFAVHGPIPPPFGDEGAANHLRLATSHGTKGVEIFVYGSTGGLFPARQQREASAAIARMHGLDPEHVIFAEQSSEAVSAGAFHNDVVAVANENLLLVHEQAFVQPTQLYEDLHRRLPSLIIEEVPSSAVSLADAISTYLFNSQLVTLPEGGMALILPTELRDNPRVWAWLEGLIARNWPVRRLETVDIRQSMANGGGPACLRLRVLADPAWVDPRYLADHAKLDRIEAIVRRSWPTSIDPADLGNPVLWTEVRAARNFLLDGLGLAELGV
jgi:succinylarginine dihydrolase